MRYIAVFLVIIGMIVPAIAEVPLTVELATGFAAGHFPAHSGWIYKVNPDNLYYREYAGRLSLGITRSLVGHFALSWNENRYVKSDHTLSLEIPPNGYYYNNQPNQKLLSSSIAISLNSPGLRLSLGILYFNNLNGVSDGDDYILNGDQGYLPTISMELGQRGYIFGSFMNSLPLYSNGILSFGIGARYPDGYDQKVYIDLAPGIGYRGEYRIYKNFSMTMGLFYNEIGNNNALACNVGVKSGFAL